MSASCPLLSRLIEGSAKNFADYLTSYLQIAYVCIVITKVQQMNVKANYPEVGMETRFALVRAFLRDRGVSNYLSAFAACGVRFDEADSDRIRLLWNGRSAVTDADAEILSRMEGVVSFLKTSRAA